jgi:hypothetical protein
VEPLDVAKALNLKKLRITRGEIDACCPLHHDRHPSFRMNRKTGQWICYAGCGAGNIPTLLKHLGRTDLMTTGGRPDVYTRTTDRTSGSIADLLEQMRLAEFMLNEGYRREDVVRGLQDSCEISRSTAYEIVGWLTGKRRLWLDDRGRLRGRRYVYCMKYLREHSKEHRLAVKAEKGHWAERARIVRSYMVARSIQEVKYGLRLRRGTPVSIRTTVEEAEAALHVPQPPPEIRRWTPWEIEILTAEVMERQARGLSLLAYWEMESKPVEFETDHFDFIGLDEFGYTMFSAPTSALAFAA